MSDGAPMGACPDLMPQHQGAESAPNNTGFFLLSDVIDSGTYQPGQTYQGKIIVSERFLYSLGEWSDPSFGVAGGVT